jgi:hypothetical protein
MNRRRPAQSKLRTKADKIAAAIEACSNIDANEQTAVLRSAPEAMPLSAEVDFIRTAERLRRDNASDTAAIQAVVKALQGLASYFPRGRLTAKGECHDIWQ